jgi:hypothetical protein
VRTLGYQVVDKVGRGSALRAFSPFEYAQHMHNKRIPPKGTRALLSNSLAVRKLWIEDQGATGFVPSDIRSKKVSDSDVPVILIGSDVLNPGFWQKLEQFQL